MATGLATGLATIYEALHQDAQTYEFVEELHQTAAKEFWYQAIAVLQQFSIQQQLKGLLLTHHPYIFANAASRQTDLQTWVFTTSKSSLFPTGRLPIGKTPIEEIQVVSIPKSDPLNQEWLCILITETFSALVVSSHTNHSCVWSLHPQAIQSAIAVLLPRIRRPEQQALLQANLQKFALKMPPYQIMARFGAILMAQSSIHQELPIPEIQEVDIIKAITHEVRTPLTTIRMLVRSLSGAKIYLMK